MFDINKVYRVETLDDLLKLRSEKSVIIVNGGTDILIKLKKGMPQIPDLVCIQDMKELKGIIFNEKEGIRIMAGTCFTDIVSHPVIQRKLPGFAYACSQVGGPQIRNVATLGGNICNGAVSADSVPSLLVLNAKLILRSVRGTRKIYLEDFYTGPGHTVIEQDEVLTAVEISSSDYEGLETVYLKFGQRNAMEIATIGCAVAVKTDPTEGIIEDFRIAYGVAAPTPVRCKKTESFLKGASISENTWKPLILKHVLEELKPRESFRASKRLREQIIKEFAVRGIRTCIQKSGGGSG